MRAATIDELEQWVEAGASWRPLELTDDHTVVELCTCSGEPVDAVKSTDPRVIRFVREHRGDD